METPANARYPWRRKALAVFLVALCAMVGVFLTVYPWMPCEPGFPCWDNNRAVNLLPRWSQIWKSPYFRGAVSGLGLVNIYVALLEAVGLRRFSQDEDD
ncbi:MAG: hypothetical protein IT160_08000 [Bryobacterales bacterium]|nr:hypothetical protein [Bryobacterales bacterium]